MKSEGCAEALQASPSSKINAARILAKTRDPAGKEMQPAVRAPALLRFSSLSVLSLEQVPGTSAHSQRWARGPESARLAEGGDLARCSHKCLDSRAPGWEGPGLARWRRSDSADAPCITHRPLITPCRTRGRCLALAVTQMPPQRLQPVFQDLEGQARPPRPRLAPANGTAPLLPPPRPRLSPPRPASRPALANGVLIP